MIIDKHKPKGALMKFIYLNLIAILIIISLIGGCNSGSKTKKLTPIPVKPTKVVPPTTTTALRPETLALDISEVPQSLINTYTKELKFNRYTKVDTPDGNAIHIVAQDEITDNQIVRSRNILQHYLTNYSGSVYGEDKSAVANKIAENNGVLLLLNGEDDGTNTAAELTGQPLYYSEMQVEGGSWYINQNYEHRDASYEEILHLVHDYGIGVDQNTTFNGVLPVYQANIRAAQINALSDKLWAWSAEQASWISELTAENSLSQEYLASVVDSYYGLWGANKESSFGMWGVYIAKTRDDLASKDPQGLNIMDNKFFHPYLTYNARIDESFIGDFSLSFNANLLYTHHSQYLKDVTLTGNNSSNVVVNKFDNNITGNSAQNTVIFSGSSSVYQVSYENGRVIVQDMRDNQDGLNTLTSIEKLQFSDTTVDVPDS